jgi:hypothetical protein
VGAFLLRGRPHGQNAAVLARLQLALNGNQASRDGVIRWTNPDLAGVDIAIC